MASNKNLQSAAKKTTTTATAKKTAVSSY